MTLHRIYFNSLKLLQSSIYTRIRGPTSVRKLGGMQHDLDPDPADRRKGVNRRGSVSFHVATV